MFWNSRLRVSPILSINGLFTDSAQKFAKELLTLLRSSGFPVQWHAVLSVCFIGLLAVRFNSRSSWWESWGTFGTVRKTIFRPAGSVGTSELFFYYVHHKPCSTLIKQSSQRKFFEFRTFPKTIIAFKSIFSSIHFQVGLFQRIEAKFQCGDLSIVSFNVI